MAGTRIFRPAHSGTLDRHFLLVKNVAAGTRICRLLRHRALPTRLTVHFRDQQWTASLEDVGPRGEEELLPRGTTMGTNPQVKKVNAGPIHEAGHQVPMEWADPGGGGRAIVAPFGAHRFLGRGGAIRRATFVLAAAKKTPPIRPATKGGDAGQKHPKDPRYPEARPPLTFTTIHPE